MAAFLRSQEVIVLEEKNISANHAAEIVPELRLKINGSEYIVGIHFSESAVETLDDKLCSLARRELSVKSIIS